MPEEACEQAAPLLDIRVGTVTKCWEHPEAEKLYCEEIDIGEKEGPRTIASGLRPFCVGGLDPGPAGFSVCQPEGAEHAGLSVEWHGALCFHSRSFEGRAVGGTGRREERR